MLTNLAAITIHMIVGFGGMSVESILQYLKEYTTPGSVTESGPLNQRSQAYEGQPRPLPTSHVRARRRHVDLATETASNNWYQDHAKAPSLEFRVEDLGVRDKLTS